MAVKIRFTKALSMPKPSKRSQRNLDLLFEMESYLKQKEPETVLFLTRNLQKLPNVVTYKELREAYLSGGLSKYDLQDWQERYGKLIDTTLRSEWYDAALQAALEEQKKYPFIYDPARSEALKWIDRHGAELVTNLAQEQMDALNAIIYHYSGYESATPDEVARQMRAVIGLTKPQAIANARYYESVKTAWLKENPKGRISTAEKYAREAAAKYAGKQHRYRAKCIARTELMFGYNAGLYGATKDAQAQGYIGTCTKRWVTAHDGPPNRVCVECQKLDGFIVGMDDSFPNGKLIPPGHPQCRCVVDYLETPATVTPPPVAKPAGSGTIEADTFRRVETNTSKGLEARGIEYREVKAHAQKLEDYEIIERIAGGDMTTGSCASAALAYCGQQNGWDVLDFRGGDSMDFFSRKIYELEMFKELGATVIEENSAKTDLTNAKRILKKLEGGKKYFLSAGKHAAIVRVSGEHVQFLELQDERMNCNGWLQYENTEQMLKYRFGCSPKRRFYTAVHATEISQLNGDEFRTILGYINTDPAKQKKGTNGSVK